MSCLVFKASNCLSISQKVQPFSSHIGTKQGGAIVLFISRFQGLFFYIKPFSSGRNLNRCYIPIRRQVFTTHIPIQPTAPILLLQSVLYYVKMCLPLAYVISNVATINQAFEGDDVAFHFFINFRFDFNRI